jgi:hypothetical protein
MNPDQATTNFYYFFRQKTADGHIFNQDRSLVWPDAKLIEEEKKERGEWEQVLESLLEHYTGAGAPPRPQVTSLALLFQLRLCPPIRMETCNVESIWSNNRSTTRLYPSRDGISVWKSVRRDVSRFGRDDFPPHQFYKLTEPYEILVMEAEVWSEEYWITTTLRRSLQRA